MLVYSWPRCKLCARGAETHDTDLLLQCCWEGSVGQDSNRGQLCASLSFPTLPREQRRQPRRMPQVPSLLQPCIGGGISFLPFSSCAPIRNLAGLFKDCFVKDIIQKGIIQFSIDPSPPRIHKSSMTLPVWQGRDAGDFKDTGLSSRIALQAPHFSAASVYLSSQELWSVVSPIRV